MKVVRFITGCLLLQCCFCLFVMGNVAAAAGAPTDLQRLHWKGRTIKIAVSSSLTRPNVNIKLDSDVLGALNRSLQTWSAAADIDLQTEFSDRQSVSPA